MTQAPVRDKVTVGNVEMISLSDGEKESLASFSFPDVPAADWAKYPGVVSPEGKLKGNFACFVIRSQGQTILVDTGLGPHRGGRLLDELKAKGVAPDDVDVVAITHLHNDHVGWNINFELKIRLTFPNARYWIPKDDWDYFFQPEILDENGYLEVLVRPLEKLGALELVEGETAINSEVTMVPSPGHTPGHMSLVIVSQGERGYILGDIIGHSVQASEPAWDFVWDIDRPLARRTREAVLEQLERDGSLIGASHIMPPDFGRIVQSQGRRYWQGI